DGEIAVTIFERTCRLLYGAIDEAAQGCQCTHRIGIRRIAGQGKRLAATSSKVDRLSRATAARLQHPVVAAVRLKGRRLGPDPTEGTISDVVEVQRGDVGGT